MLYSSYHNWIRKNYGRADKCSNIDCRKICKKYEWSHIHGKPMEKNIESFRMMCISCHRLYDITDNTRKKMSICRIGKKHPLFGTHRSKETKKKMSKSLIGRKVWNKGLTYKLK